MKYKKLLLQYNAFGLKFVKKNYILLSIFALALFLRLLGIYPGYPINHPDEPIVRDSARQIALYGNFKPESYYYGELLSIIYALVILLFFFPIRFITFFITHLSEFIDKGFVGFWEYFRYGLFGYDSDPYHYFIYWTRYESAVLCASTIFFVYLVGKRLFGKEVALIASFLTAVNYRHVLSSVFTLADAPASFFALLSTYLSTNLLKNQSLRTYLLAGTGVGCALSVKYFVYILPVFLLCHILGVWSQSQFSFLVRIRKIIVSPNFLLASIWALLLFFIINPYLIFDYKTASWQLFVYNARRYGFDGVPQIRIGPQIFYPLYHLWWYYLGPTLSVGIVVGMIYSVFRYRSKSLLILSVVLPFLFIFIFISGGSYVRNYSAIIPFLLFFPAMIIVKMSTLVGKKYAMYAMVLLTLLSGGFSLKQSFLSSYYFSMPHNQERVNTWLEQSFPNKASIFNIGSGLPSNKAFKDIPAVFNSHSFVSMEEVKKSSADWVVVSSYVPPLSNTELWIEKQFPGMSFTNQDVLFDFIDNTYVSLAVTELGYYRIKEFAQKSLYALDRVFYVGRVPTFWAPREDKEIAAYVFKTEQDTSLWSVSSIEEPKPKTAGFIVDSEDLLVVDWTQCIQRSNLVVSSPLIPIAEKKWHTLIGIGKRENSAAYAQYRAGFIRLDFLSSDKHTRMKTYVSKQFESSDDWQKLVAAGFSPEGASYARVSLELDNCYEPERYIIQDVHVYESNAIEFIDKKQYPYFDTPLPKTFIWKYEL